MVRVGTGVLVLGEAAGLFDVNVEVCESKGKHWLFGNWSCYFRGGDCVLAWRWLDGYESEARMDF